MPNGVAWLDGSLFVAVNSGIIRFDNIDETYAAPPPPVPDYDASKWGIRGLTEAWAEALRPHRIRVNELCMGATNGEMLREFLGDRATPELVASWLRPEDLGRVLIDLLAEGPDGRTGTQIGLWVGHPVELPPAHPQPVD